MGGMKIRRLHAGAGVTYARIADINGMLVTGNLAADLLKTRLTPFIYFNGGYSHFWNQYEGGTGTVALEPGAGFRFRLIGNKSIFLSAGNLLIQRNSYWSIKTGIMF